MSGTPAITLEDVSFTYGGPLVLEGIDLSVARGEFLGLVGPNAGGKSTLLKLILGLLRPGRGRVQVLGEPPTRSYKSIGYVPQHPSFSRDFPISVMETVLLGRLGRTRTIGGYRNADRIAAARALTECEIDDVADRRLATLSGGQFQRVLLARALVGDPQILILDEPTANIDLRAEQDIFDLLKHLNSRMTIIVVSHDIAFVSRYVTRVACLSRTLVCHQPSELSGDVIQELYGDSVQMVHHMDGHGHDAS